MPGMRINKNIQRKETAPVLEQEEECGMKEKPILFSEPMVRAILDGRKTQTRRVVKGNPVNLIRFIGSDDLPTGEFGLCQNYENVIEKHIKSPYGNPRDRIWVREGFSGPYYQSKTPPREWSDCDPIWYWADGNPENGDWTKPKPSIHMPRWASRIDLEITGVRVERLQDVSKQDSFSEGIQSLSDGDYYEFGIRGLCSAQHPIRAYQLLWESINGSGSWDKNPWIWVIEFKRV